MASKWMRKLGIGMSAIMTVSQLSGMVAMAAPEDDFGDRLEEQFEAEAEDIDDDAEAALLDVEEEDIDNVEITAEELIPPIDVKWEAPGVYSFVVNSTQEMFYGSEVYCNGERWGSATFGSYISKEGIGYKEVDHYESCFLESGTYTVKIYVAATDSQDAPKVYAAEIPEISWTCPDNKISAPINLHWEKKDDEHFAIVACDPVEHAYAYSFSLYNDQGYVSGVYTINNYFDFSDKIGDMSNNDYYVTACAYSDDLYKYANSDLSEKSPSLTINGGMVTTQKDIVDIGKNVNAGNIDEKVQQVKDIDNSTLKSSLQTSNEALQAMGKIEDEYKNAKGIEVLPATSDVEKIAANKIEMTGAALNVSEGTIQLNVKDQKEAGSSIINTDIYTNIIAFDMSVNSSEGVDFSKELEVPVTIAMPIPEGMDSSRLVILHYRADGAEELITPRIENGKAIFAITHFSTFALAEKKGSSEADVPDGSAPRIIVAEDGSSKVYQYGKEIENYTGLAMLGTTETAPWVYVENNKRNETFSGFVDYDGETFYVAGGTMATDLNGLQVNPSNGKDWYFLAGGQVQKHHEGLALYNGEWFYIKDGRLDTNLNAFVDYDGGKFFVGAGRIIQEYNGLAQDPQNTVNGDWYFLANGQAQTQYTGLASYDNAWFYVINGKLATDYTGTVDYDGATFNVVGGMVTTSESSGETGNTISAADLSIEITNMDQFWGEYNRVLSDYATNKGWTAWTYDNGFGLQIFLKKENVVELRFEVLDSRNNLPNPVYVAVGEYDPAYPEFPYDVNEVSFDIDIRTLGDVKNLMDKY